MFADLDDDSPTERAQRMITPEVRGILKSGTTVVPKPKTLAKGESSEVHLYQLKCLIKSVLQCCGPNP